MKRDIAMILPPREGFSSGASGAIGLLAHRLARRARLFSPTVLGMPPSAPPFADVPFRPVTLSRLPGREAWRYARGLTRVLASRPPALIEVHNRPDIALFLAARFPAIPVTLTLHNDPQGMRRARQPAERGWLLARLARVIAVSSWVEARLLEGVVTPVRRPVVLVNCLELADLPPLAEERATEILFAGRVVRDKGADAFIAACALALPRLPGWRARMIGADRFGPDSPETPWIAALRPLAAAAGVAMAGYRPHGEVLAAMARAAIVAVPSRWPEPFGLTALEAMACGAALLHGPHGALPELAGVAGVAIDPDDPAAMAATMVALASDAPRRAALGAAGRVRALLFDAPAAAAAREALNEAVLHAWPEPAAHPI